MRIISVQDIIYGDRADTAFKVHEGDQHVLYFEQERDDIIDLRSSGPSEGVRL